MDGSAIHGRNSGRENQDVFMAVLEEHKLIVIPESRWVVQIKI